MWGGVKSCDYSPVGNCTDKHTEAQASFGNDGKQICMSVQGVSR